MKKLLDTMFIGALAALNVVPNALADPSQEIRRLMNEPVSMLDWGLEQMERQLQEALSDDGIRKYAGLPADPPGISLDYDRDTNRILVHAFYVGEGQRAAKVICHKTVTFLRKQLDPRYPNGKERGDHLWLSNFLHSGSGDATRTTAWKVLEKALPNLVMLEVVVPSADAGADVRCSAPLTGVMVSFEQ